MRIDTIYNIEYWIKKGFDVNDAKLKVEQSKKETSWRCKEFWVKRGYSEEDAIEEISRKQSVIALKRDRAKKIRNPYSVEYYLEKGFTNNEEIDLKIKELKNKSNIFLVCSSDKIKSIIEKRKETYYKKTKEEREEINKSRGLTKNDIIKKFGIEKSNEIFKNRGKGVRMPYEKKFSKISLSLFKILSEHNNNFTFVYGKNEKFIPIKGIKNRKGYFVDFFFEEEEKIIEFNGDFWHFNPKKYLSESYTVLNNIKVIAKDVWIKDEEKRKNLINSGYQLLTIWEMDYIENKEYIIKLCNEFINKKE